MDQNPFEAFAPAAAGDLAFIKRLQESQWWRPDELLAHQLKLLLPLLRHASATIPFYRARIEDAGIDLGAPLRLEDWRRLPKLSRREVQQSPERLASNAVPETHGSPISMHTSGSTNVPVTVTSTTRDAWVTGAATLRHFLWHPYDFSGRMLTIRRVAKGKAEYPHGEESDRWANEAIFPFATGPSAFLNISASIDRQIDWLVAKDPDYLCTYPSNAIQLALASRRRGITFPHLERVVSMGEVVAPELRQLCADVWDAPVIDTYSAQEIGVLAHQCSDHPHYHVQAETALVEILNEHGAPCRPGETGEVVVTSLTNYAMPLLRYAIGDFAEVGVPCACGRGLPVLTQILGRARNSVLIAPTGERFWPAFGTYGFAKIAPVIQFQFVQKAIDRLEARFVTERALTADEEAALRKHIGGQLRWRFDVELAYVDEIPRSASGKFEAFVSELEVSQS